MMTRTCSACGGDMKVRYHPERHNHFDNCPAHWGSNRCGGPLTEHLEWLCHRCGFTLNTPIMEAQGT